jgi:hypothetical protein
MIGRVAATPSEVYSKKIHGDPVWSSAAPDPRALDAMKLSLHAFCYGFGSTKARLGLSNVFRRFVKPLLCSRKRLLD